MSWNQFFSSTYRVIDHGIFDYGTVHMYQAPCKHLVKVDEAEVAVSPDAVRRAVIAHMAEHTAVEIMPMPGLGGPLLTPPDDELPRWTFELASTKES